MTDDAGPAFDAWTLPPGVSPPAVAERSVGGVRVRHPDPDPGWITALGRELRGRREALRDVPVARMVDVLGRVGGRFRDLHDPLRHEALALLPPTSGLSAPMASAVLDGMAADWVPDRLWALLHDALGDPAVLDGFEPAPLDGAPGRRLRAVGPELCVQVVAGSVPGVGATALVRSLLAKGPTLLKPGLGDVVLPTLFARALAEEDATLGAAVAVLYWPGGRAEVEAAAVAEADVVVAYGGDAAVRALRDATPVTARFQAYHHRVSLGVVGREALAPATADAAARAVAEAVAFFDQRGCVSPREVWVEEGASVTPADFARQLAVALDDLEARLPSGRLDVDEASAVQQVRGMAEMTAASGSGTVHRGADALWTVILDPSGAPAAGCVGRVVRVRPVADAADVARRVAPLGPHLQTVAVTGLGPRLGAVADALARAGAGRIAPFADAPFPPAWWRHDGRDPLAPLVRWTETTE